MERREITNKTTNDDEKQTEKNNTKQQFRACHRLRIKPPNQIALYTKQLEAI